LTLSRSPLYSVLFLARRSIPSYFAGENNTQLQANQTRSAWRVSRTVEDSSLERVWKLSEGCTD